jgi:integrase
LDAAAKRVFRDCECMIWLAGRTDDQVWPRQSTHLRDWAAAEALRVSRSKEALDVTVHGPTIAECVKRYLESREEELNYKVLKQYRLLLGRLQTFAQDRGAYHVRELTVDLLEDFKIRGLPEVKATTRKSAMVKVRTFMHTAHRRQWILSPVHDLVLPVRGAVHEAGMPFTPVEVDKILGAATGTFRLLIEMMLRTGMRVSDACRYDPAVPEKDASGVWIYPFVQTKRKLTQAAKRVEAYVPDDLKVRIDRCDWMSPKLPFWPAQFTDRYRVGIWTWEQMRKIGNAIGMSDVRPHRCRDTYAVNMLLSGISISDLSRLLGHSSVTVTESHYLRWIPERQVRLAGIVAETLKNPVDR